MNGFWVYDYPPYGEFRSLNEMWGFIRREGEFFDTNDINQWVNQNYSAASVLWMFIDDNDIDQTYVDILDEFVDSEWSPEVMPLPIEGEDYDYNGYLFRWVDEDKRRY